MTLPLQIIQTIIRAGAAVDHRGGYHPIPFEPMMDDDEEIFVLLMTEILLNE